LAAVWAGPFFFFFLDELSYSGLFYKFLILNHTHRIFCPVPLVQTFQPGAWKCIAIKTEFGFEFFSLFAIPYYAA